MKPPVVEARRTPSGRGLTVDCCCGQTHHHGAIGPEPGDGDGHRVAHCHPGIQTSLFGKARCPCGTRRATRGALMADPVHARHVRCAERHWRTGYVLVEVAA